MLLSKAPLLHGRYPASSLLWASPTPDRTAPSVMYSRGPLGHVPHPPPCRVSQVPRLIYPRALSPTTPESPAAALPVASPPVAGSSSSADWPPSGCVTRPNRVRLRCGSRVRLTGFRRTDRSIPRLLRLHVERAIYMVNSFQFTRSARLSLVYQRRRENQGRGRTTYTAKRKVGHVAVGPKSSFVFSFVLLSAYRLCGESALRTTLWSSVARNRAGGRRLRRRNRRPSAG